MAIQVAFSCSFVCKLEEQGRTSSISWELAPAQCFPQDLQGQGAGQTRSSIWVPILTHRASQKKTPPKLDSSLSTSWEEPGLSTQRPPHPGTSESGNLAFILFYPGKLPSLLGSQTLPVLTFSDFPVDI